jgi:hypothetical protein
MTCITFRDQNSSHMNQTQTDSCELSARADKYVTAAIGRALLRAKVYAITEEANS